MLTIIDSDMQTNESKPMVARLKGVGDGLWVTVDPSQPPAVLESALNDLFKPLKQLAVSIPVVIDGGEKAASEDLVNRLGAYLQQKFRVGSVSAAKSAQTAPRQKRTRRRDLGNHWQTHRSNVLLMTGRVRAGQKIIAQKHLVLMGDVNPGGEVVAGGDIVVLGILRGIAAAGQPDHEESIVFALDFRPTQVQIGGRVAAGLPPSSIRQAEFAYVENQQIVVEAYLEANPFGKMPWPEKR